MAFIDIANTNGIEKRGARPITSARRRWVAGLAVALGATALIGSPALAQTVPAAAPPPCVRYDALMLRGVDTPLGSVCETIAPELGGVRSALADYGIGVFSFWGVSATYDVRGHDARPQTYVGQIPTFVLSNFNVFTYDMGRLGDKGAQISFIPVVDGASYINAQDRGPYVAQLSFFQPLFDDHVEVQAGYSRMATKFAFSIAGTTLAMSAIGPISSIPYSLGLSAFRPTPNADIRIFSPNKDFYTHFGVSRSVSPAGFVEDARLNPSGFRFSVPGARELFVNETGYDVESSAEHKKIWVRGGVIYNNSAFPIFSRPGQTGDNFGYFAFADFQLTMPNKSLPFQGLYVGAKFDKARDDCNPFQTDYSGTIYKIGTFDSRPFDVVAVGVSQSYVGSGLLQSLRQVGLNPVGHTFAVDGNYTYRMQGGLYLNVGMTYTDNPTIAVKSPSAINGSVGINALF